MKISTGFESRKLKRFVSSFCPDEMLANWMTNTEMETKKTKTFISSGIVVSSATTGSGMRLLDQRRPLLKQNKKVEITKKKLKWIQK